MEIFTKKLFVLSSARRLGNAKLHFSRKSPSSKKFCRNILFLVLVQLPPPLHIHILSARASTEYTLHILRMKTYNSNITIFKQKIRIFCLFYLYFMRWFICKLETKRSYQSEPPHGNFVFPFQT